MKIRNAWKLRLAGCPPVLRVAAGMLSRITSAKRLEFVNNSTSRSLMIRSAIRDANLSSPYSRKIRANSFPPKVFTTSAAVTPSVESIRISSGASCA